QRSTSFPAGDAGSAAKSPRYSRTNASAPGGGTSSSWRRATSRPRATLTSWGGGTCRSRFPDRSRTRTGSARELHGSARPASRKPAAAAAPGSSGSLPFRTSRGLVHPDASVAVEDRAHHQLVVSVVVEIEDRRAQTETVGRRSSEARSHPPERHV